MTTITDIISKLSNDNKSIVFDLMQITMKKLVPTSGKTLNVKKCGGINNGTPNIKCGNNLDLNLYKYTYPNDTIGWIEDSINRFKISPFTYLNPRTEGYNSISPNEPYKIVLTGTMILAFNDNSPQINYTNGTSTSNQTRSPARLNVCQKRANIVNLILQQEIGSEYESNLPYTESFKQLQKLGDQFLKELNMKNPNTPTLKLRRSLLTLDNDLLNFKSKYPDLYASYIDMITLINSIDSNHISAFIRFISNITYVDYNDLTQEQKDSYETIFGMTFINNFINNTIANLILDSEMTELIVSSSYLYSTLKGLFCMFGYSEIIPRYDPLVCKPISKCVYEKINIFNNVYPNITEIMGGTENLPNECVLVDCSKIPNNYDGLNTIPSYLWRWNDFSYCKYVENLAKNDKIISLSAKISNKSKYINSI